MLTEGPDLVADFRAEAWPGVLQRFDAEKAAFGTYLSAAFLHFTRPRLVRAAKWRAMLRPLDALASLPAVEEPDVASIERMRSALARLPGRDREFLEARVADGLRERSAARRFDLGRYAYRQRCAEALARLAALLDPEAFKPADRALAKGVWGEGRPLADVSSALGMSLSQGRAVRRRILAAFAASLAKVEGRPVKKERIMADSDCDLWTALLKNPRDPAAVEACRGRLEDFTGHLETCEACAGLMPKEGREAEILEALGAAQGEALSDREQASLDALMHAQAADRKQVELAIQDALLPGLAEDQVSPPENVEPLVLFRAMDCLSKLAHRVSLPSQVLRESGALEAEGGPSIPADKVLAEIARSAEVSPNVAGRLVDWMRRAARTHPRLLPGVTSEPVGKGDARVVLEVSDLSENLFERWAPAAVAEEQSSLDVWQAIPIPWMPKVFPDASVVCVAAAPQFTTACRLESGRFAIVLSALGLRPGVGSARVELRGGDRMITCRITAADVAKQEPLMTPLPDMEIPRHVSIRLHGFQAADLKVMRLM